MICVSSKQKLFQTQIEKKPFKIQPFGFYYLFHNKNCPIEKNTHPLKIIELKIFSFPQQKLPN